MASNYPGSLDSFDTIASDKKTSDAVGGRTHRQMHNDLGDAIESVQTELGTNPSGSDATVAARLTAIEAGTNLGANSVGATALADNAVDTNAIQAKAVTAAKIADDTITATQIAANAVGTSELADSAVDTAAIQDGAVTAAKLAVQPGNLLTANQASGGDASGDATGFALWGGASFARSTAQAAQGTGSILITFDGTGAGDVCTLRSSAAVMPAVTAGDIVTVTAKMRQNVGTRNGRLLLAFYNESASLVAYSSVVTATLSTSWAELAGTHVVPAGATRAIVVIGTTSSGSASDSVYADSLSLHRGAAGVYSTPGLPVTGQSRIAVNGAVDLSGTGTPEGVVTAAPGSTWLQTDATTDVKGWIKWVKATGTGNTGWVAGPEADTGWRDVSASIIGANGWTGGTVTVRRYGNSVWLDASGLTRASGGSGVVVALPSGFCPRDTTFFSAYSGSMYVTNTGNFVYNASGTTSYGAGSFATDNTWPSSLPGSAA